MANYRRLLVPGGSCFFTMATHRRQPRLTRPAVMAALRQAIVDTRRRLPFTIEAWVVLPDHLHAVWTLPDGDADFSRRGGVIKAAVARAVVPLGEAGGPVDPVRQRRRESGLWQRRFWEPWLRDEADLAAHIDYVHFNPVKHRLVAEVAAWPWSTFHRWVRDGRYPAAWAGPVAGSAVPAGNDQGAGDFGAG